MDKTSQMLDRAPIAWYNTNHPDGISIMSRKRNLEARDKILEAGHLLFYERGFKGSSMDDVAKEAGVKKANLFHYFRTKEKLALAVLDRVTENFKETGCAELALGGRDPVKAVEKMFRVNCDRLKENECCRGCFVGNLAQELSDHNEKMRAKISEYFRFWAEKLAQLLSQGQKDGRLSKELNPAQAARAILALLEGATLFCKASKDTTTFDHARKMAVGYLEGFKTTNGGD